MIHRRLKALVSIFSLVAVCALAACLLVACASEPEQKDQQLRKAEKAQPTVEVEKPSPEELANSPCGNPDWAQLPEGAEGKASQQSDQPDQPDQPAQPEDGADDGTGEDADEDAQEQSNRGDLYPNNQPCT